MIDAIRPDGRANDKFRTIYPLRCNKAWRTDNDRPAIQPPFKLNPRRAYNVSQAIRPPLPGLPRSAYLFDRNITYTSRGH